MRDSIIIDYNIMAKGKDAWKEKKKPKKEKAK